MTAATLKSGGAATEVRGTIIVSSLQMIRDRGLLDKYVASLDPAAWAAIQGIIAASWVPIQRIVDHYGACDKLGFTAHELIDLGRDLTRRLHHPVMKVTLGVVGAAGVTPWSLLPLLPRLWERMYRGGSIETIQKGPKEALVVIRGFPCAGIRYSRIAWRGVLLGGVETLAARAYVNEVSAQCDAMNLAYRVSWA